MPSITVLAPLLQSTQFLLEHVYSRGDCLPQQAGGDGNQSGQSLEMSKTRRQVSAQKNDNFAHNFDIDRYKLKVIAYNIFLELFPIFHPLVQTLDNILPKDFKFVFCQHINSNI